MKFFFRKAAALFLITFYFHTHAMLEKKQTTLEKATILKKFHTKNGNGYYKCQVFHEPKSTTIKFKLKTIDSVESIWKKVHIRMTKISGVLKQKKKTHLTIQPIKKVVFFHQLKNNTWTTSKQYESPEILFDKKQKKLVFDCAQKIARLFKKMHKKKLDKKINCEIEHYHSINDFKKY